MAAFQIELAELVERKDAALRSSLADS